MTKTGSHMVHTERLTNCLHSWKKLRKYPNDLNKDYLDYDYQEKDDSFDGRITISLKGLHCTPTLYR